MLKALLTGATMTAVIPFALILSQWPTSIAEEAGGLNFERLSRPDLQPSPLEAWQGPDGAQLGVRRYMAANPEAPLIVMIHGSGWHGLQFDGLAKRVAAANLGNVLVPDLRGHGPNPARRGDLDYIGQFEDDLAALVEQNRRAGQKVVFLGHSSGGGLVLRFAGGHHSELLDGAILLAPFLGHDAPTTRPNSGGWARPLVRRIIGLSILNQFRITGLNGLTAIQFRFPKSVLDGPLGHTVTASYSFRLNTSYAPRRHLAGDAAALPPFLLVAGKNDEAFRADQYEPTLSKMNGQGRYAILPDVGHLDVVNAEGAFDAIQNWLRAFDRLGG